MGKKLIILFFSTLFLFILNQNANATHIFGGDITYVYKKDTLGGTQHIYSITLTLYQDCNSINWGPFFPENQIPIYAFEGALNATSLNHSGIPLIALLTLTDTSTLRSNLPPNCALTGANCINKTVYTGDIILPTSFLGYHFIYDRCCRTDQVTNILVPVNSSTDGSLIHSWTSSTVTKNNSPKFRDFNFPFFCIGKENSVINLAQDPDGDLLNYSLYAPFDGLAQNGSYQGGYNLFPPSTVNYRTTPDVYSAQNPLGNNGTLTLNGLNGYTTMKTNRAGIYVVGVRVSEIDKLGNTIGVVHREYQFPFVNCNDTNQTKPTLVGTGKLDYEIDAGDTLCFDIKFEDKGGSPIDYLYQVDGLIFNPSFTNPPATLTTPVFTNGKSKSNQTFCWSTTCEQGRPTKYYFSASVADSACIPSSNAVVFSVLVNPSEAPKKIDGPTNLCAGSSSILYTTDTIVGLTYNWDIVGGTIVSGSNGPSIIVDWGNGPGGNLKVWGVDANGCTGDTIDKAIFITTFPVDAGNDRIICLGDSTLLGSTGGVPTAPFGFKLKWSPNTSLNNDTLQNPKAFPTKNTRYFLTVTDSTGLCSVVDTVFISVANNPNAFLLSKDTTICEGNQVTLKATGGIKYDWSPGKLLNDSTIANPTTNITSNQLFIVTINGAVNTCPTVDSVLVTVDGQDDLNPGIDSSICIGSSYTLGSLPTGTPNAKYKWSPSALLNNDTISNPIYTPANIGITTFYVTMTSEIGCIFNDSVKIQVDTIPNIQLLIGRNAVCENDTTFLLATGGISYIWSDLTLIGAGPHIVSPTMSINYTVTGTDGNYCSNTDNKKITIKAIPKILIPYDSVFLCNLDTLTIPTTAGAAGYSWTPNYNISSTSAANPKVYPRKDTTYVVLFTNLNGCDAMDSIWIDVGGEVPTDAGDDVTICFPDTIQIGGKPTSPLFNTTYTWTPSSRLNNNKIANPSAFPYKTETYTVNTVNGKCGGQDSVVVTVKPKPSLTFTKDPYAFCLGDTVEVDTLSSMGFIQSFSVFPTPSDVINGTNYNLTFLTNKSIDYNVALLDSNGCRDTSTFSLDLRSQPTIMAGNDSAICPGEKYQLTSSGASNYSWSPSELLNKPNSPNPVAEISETTTYIVKGTDQAGCSGLDTVTITVYPLPFIDAGESTFLCSNDTTRQIQLGSNASTDKSLQYVWSPSTNLNDASIPNPIHTVSIPRTYIVLVKDTFGCVNVDSVEIGNYSFNINSIDVTCFQDSLQFNVFDTLGQAPFTYQWKPTSGLSNPTIPNPKVYVEESTSYQIIATDSRGCIDSIRTDVIVSGAVKADFDMSYKASCDEVRIVTFNKSSNAIEYNWYLNNEYKSSDDSPVFEVPYSNTFTISLEAKNNENCVSVSDSTSTLLNFNDYFNEEKLPNVFTPNGDGINDLFDFRLGSRLEQCSNIKIYNRWGVLVFESRENAHIWDGSTFTGEACVQGQYFFTLEVNRIIYKGSLTLILD